MGSAAVYMRVREWGKTAERFQVALSGGEYLLLPAAPDLARVIRPNRHEPPMMLDEPRRRQGGRDHAVNGGRHHVGIPAAIISE